MSSRIRFNASGNALTIRAPKAALCSSFILAAALLTGFARPSLAQTPQTMAPADGSVTLFQNVRIFDGKGDTVSGPMNVLVRGNVIERITAASKRERVTLPSSSTDMSQTRHSRSTSGFSEQRPLDSASGSIGSTRFGK